MHAPCIAARWFFARLCGAYRLLKLDDDLLQAFLSPAFGQVGNLRSYFSEHIQVDSGREMLALACSAPQHARCWC